MIHISFSRVLIHLRRRGSRLKVVPHTATVLALKLHYPKYGAPSIKSPGCPVTYLALLGQNRMRNALGVVVIVSDCCECNAAVQAPRIVYREYSRATPQRALNSPAGALDISSGMP